MLHSSITIGHILLKKYSVCIRGDRFVFVKRSNGLELSVPINTLLECIHVVMLYNVLLCKGHASLNEFILLR